MPVTNRRPTPTRRELRTLTSEGLTRPEIARELGISLRWTERLCQRYRVKAERGGGARPDPMKRAAVMAAVVRGCHNGGLIAADLGVTRQAVARYVRELIAAGLLEASGKARWYRLAATEEWGEGGRDAYADLS